MSRIVCIITALVLTGASATARAADVCVLVSPGSKKTRPTYETVARAVLTRTLGERIDAAQLDDANAVRRSCQRVAVAVGAKALKAAHKHLADVPIVYTQARSAEQVLSGHPSLYGVSANPDPGHLFGTLQAIAPDVKRVGLVYNPKRTNDLVTLAKRVAESRGLELVALEADGTTKAAIQAFHRFEKEIAIDALWLLPDSSVLTHETADYALKLAGWGRLPVIGPSRSYVASGALFALTPNPDVHGRLAAEIADRLLRGEIPPSLQYASDNHLILSQRMADKLGLRLPAALVKRAEELIR
jgi:putative ABC transport system substrate-binding protein